MMSVIWRKPVLTYAFRVFSSTASVNSVNSVNYYNADFVH